MIVHDGAAGLAAANRYEPHGIVLDMQLPTISGLDILQELKRNPRTRHIPVHIVSVATCRRKRCVWARSATR